MKKTTTKKINLKTDNWDPINGFGSGTKGKGGKKVVSNKTIVKKGDNKFFEDSKGNKVNVKNKTLETIKFFNDEWANIPDAEATAQQVKSWNKHGTSMKIDWTLVILGVVILGLVTAIIKYDVTPLLTRADIFLPCK